jgi:transposase
VLKFLGKSCGVDGATMRSSRLSCRLGMAGAAITEVAHRHDITRQQIYAWRSELKKNGPISAFANALFIPVDRNAVQTNVLEDREICSGMIGLRLSCGRLDGATLTRVIRAVGAA